MTITLHLVLLLAAVAWINSQNDRFKQLTKDLVTFDKAKQQCQALGKQWALPDFQENKSEFLAYVNKKNIPRAWLPIRKVVFPVWTWINGTTAKQGIQEEQGYVCGGLEVQKEKLQPKNCAEGLGFICQVADGKSCPQEHFTQNCFSIGGAIYIIGCKSKNWFDARAYCRELGGDLAVVPTLVIQKKIFQHIAERRIFETCTWFFVGLRKEDWLIGEQGGVVPERVAWERDQPVQGVAGCTQLVQRGATYKWMVAECQSEAQFLCQNYGNVSMKNIRPSTYVHRNVLFNSGNASSGGLIAVAILAFLFATGCIILVLLLYHFKKKNSDKRKTAEEQADENGGLGLLLGEPNQSRRRENQDDDMKSPATIPYSNNSTDAASLFDGITVVVFSTGIDPEHHSLKGITVDQYNYPEQDRQDDSGTKIARVIADTYRIVTDGKTNLRIINLNATNSHGELAKSRAKEVLEWLSANDSPASSTNVVYLPSFSEDFTDQIRVLSLLWSLRSKMALVSHASLQAQLPACEVIAVGEYTEWKSSPSTTIDLAVSLPSRSISTDDDKEAHTYTINDTFYGPSLVCGLIAGISCQMLTSDFGILRGLSKTSIFRRSILENLETELHSLYWGFGKMKAESLRFVAAKILDSLKRNADKSKAEEKPSFSGSTDWVVTSIARNWNFQYLAGKKVKVGIIRSGIETGSDQAVFEGWNISVYPAFKKHLQNKDVRDRTTKEILIMLKAFESSGMDTKYLKNVIEIVDYPLVDDEGWRVHNWQDFKSTLTDTDCDVMHLPSITVPPSEEEAIYQGTASLRKTSVILTSAVAVNKYYIQPTYPAQCVIAVGCKEKAGQRKRRLMSSIYSSRSRNSSRAALLESQATLMDSSSQPLLDNKPKPPERQMSVGEIGWQSWGSTLDFVCEWWPEDTPHEENNPWSASFYATGIAALVIVKAYALGFDETTIKKLRSTFVMHSILRQMCSHKMNHEMEDGWGEPELWKNLNNPSRLYDIIQLCISADAPRSFWNGKNVD